MIEFAMDVASGSRMKQSTTEKLDEVAFQMIGDDYNDTKSQLDSVRARRPKFICINDNMNDPSDELIELLQDFFDSFFPIASPYEHSSQYRNLYLRYDEYTAHKRTCDICAFVIVFFLWIVASYSTFLCYKIRSSGRKRSEYTLNGSGNDEEDIMVAIRTPPQPLSRKKKKNNNNNLLTPQNNSNNNTPSEQSSRGGSAALNPSDFFSVDLKKNQ